MGSNAFNPIWRGLNSLAETAALLLHAARTMHDHWNDFDVFSVHFAQTKHYDVCNQIESLPMVNSITNENKRRWHQI